MSVRKRSRTLYFKPTIRQVRNATSYLQNTNVTYTRSKETITDEAETAWNESRRALSTWSDEALKKKISLFDYGCSMWISKDRGEFSLVGAFPSDYSSPSGVVRSIHAEGLYPLFTEKKSTHPVYDINESILRCFGAGSLGIQRFAPTSPLASSATLLGELAKDGIPIPGSSVVHALKARRWNEIAGEYLNYWFGVSPTVGDVRRIAKSVMKSGDVMRQLRRDSGQVVRRRGIVDSTRTLDTEGFGRTYPAVLPYLYSTTTPQLQDNPVTRTEALDRWFSGRFQYYLGPEADTFIDNIISMEREARLLYGLTFDASVVWELTRYSWLFDWFINIGSVLNAISLFSKDGLVMRHGYAMLHRYTQTEMSYNETLLGHVGPSYYSYTRTTEHKVRLKASPFGFDVNLDGLTAFQMSILGALGISRYPRSGFGTRR